MAESDFDLRGGHEQRGTEIGGEKPSAGLHKARVRAMRSPVSVQPRVSSTRVQTAAFLTCVEPRAHGVESNNAIMRS